MEGWVRASVARQHASLTNCKHPRTPQQSVYARGYGTVMDSGTTFTYLPTPVFAAFLSSINAAVAVKGLTKSSGPDPTVSCRLGWGWGWAGLGLGGCRAVGWLLPGGHPSDPTHPHTHGPLSPSTHIQHTNSTRTSAGREPPTTSMGWRAPSPQPACVLQGAPPSCCHPTATCF